MAVDLVALKASLHHAASQPGFTRKNEVLFDAIHGLVSKGVADATALGATAVMLAPFTDTQHVFEALRSTLVRVHLNQLSAKSDLFEAIYSLISDGIAQATALGATVAMLAPFIETQAGFASLRADILAMNFA